MLSLVSRPVRFGLDRPAAIGRGGPGFRGGWRGRCRRGRVRGRPASWGRGESGIGFWRRAEVWVLRGKAPGLGIHGRGK